MVLQSCNKLPRCIVYVHVTVMKPCFLIGKQRSCSPVDEASLEHIGHCSVATTVPRKLGAHDDIYHAVLAQAVDVKGPLPIHLQQQMCLGRQSQTRHLESVAGFNLSLLLQRIHRHVYMVTSHRILFRRH